jgi:phosphonate transport system permease protein
VVRTIPSLLWAIVFIIMVGLGPLAGVLGLAFYTLGYLGKLFYEALEAVDPEVVEAVRSTGASRAQLARHAVLPEAAHALLSQTLFVFEYNVRASSILGLVGAGGIGFYLLRYLQLLEYQALATALLLLLVAVLAIEALGQQLRRRFLPAPAPVPT